MGLAIGMAEFKSIVIGIDTADKMIKAASVNIMMAKTVCPGKFVAIISGSVEDVNESINCAIEAAGNLLIDYFVIPNVHEDILYAFKKRQFNKCDNAVGAMEFNRAASGIKALDAALKAANINLLKLNFGGGINGKSYFVINGSVSDVREAVNAAEVKTDIKRLMYKTVIPNPSNELMESFLN